MSREAVAFLAGSPDRRRLLDSLADEPGTPSDVADDLDVATRSVQRNLSQLTDRGWAEKRAGEYRLTTVGHLVRRSFVGCLEEMETIAAFEAVYGHLPGPDAAPDPAWLADATCVTTDPDHPQAPVDHYVRTIRSLDADRVRMVSPVLSRLFHEPHAKQVLAGATTELVLPAERVAAAREKNPLEFRTVVSVPRFTLYRFDGEIGFGLTVTDDRTFLLAYDDDGQLRACVESSASPLRSWAADRYEEFQRNAETVEGPGLF